jgi:hypothetical protein
MRKILAGAIASFLLTATAVAITNSMSFRNGDMVRDCSDVVVSYDHQRAQRAQQQLTIPKAQNLHVSASQNGGVYLTSWDKDEYAVTACKAAATESELNAITVTNENGFVTARGPDGGDWMAYFIVQAPRGASVELEARNGGIVLYRAEGTFNAHTQNGPVRVNNCTGELQIRAQNGPIDFIGNTGHATLEAVNGPMRVQLAGTHWNGAGLRASTVNGPIQLHLPENFESAVLVESDGHSPSNCDAPACDKAQRNWDRRGARSMRFGSGEPFVHLSTHNGPVQVRGGGEQI